MSLPDSMVSQRVWISVWAMLGSAFLFFLVFGLILFLFIWPWSAPFMLNLLAWGVGLEGKQLELLQPSALPSQICSLFLFSYDSSEDVPYYVLSSAFVP
jgi:hypothetical protein